MPEDDKKVEKPKESYMKMSDVKKLIADMMKDQKVEEKPINPKRVTEHMAHLWRLDGKWVVGFVDSNTDPYVKNPVFAFEKFNEQRREFESWINLIFHDKTTKEISLKNYCSNRIPIYCLITKREKIDKSYSIGEVEKIDWVNDRKVRTGQKVNQTVEMYDEILTLKTPEGEEITVPDYAIC